MIKNDHVDLIGRNSSLFFLKRLTDFLANLKASRCLVLDIFHHGSDAEKLTDTDVYFIDIDGKRFIGWFILGNITLRPIDTLIGPLFNLYFPVSFSNNNSISYHVDKLSGKTDYSWADPSWETTKLAATDLGVPLVISMSARNESKMPVKFSCSDYCLLKCDPKNWKKVKDFIKKECESEFYAMFMIDLKSHGGRMYYIAIKFKSQFDKALILKADEKGLFI